MPNLCTQLGPNSSVIITYKLWWGKSRRTQYFPPRHALKLKKKWSPCKSHAFNQKIRHVVHARVQSVRSYQTHSFLTLVLSAIRRIEGGKKN